MPTKCPMIVLIDLSIFREPRLYVLTNFISIVIAYICASSSEVEIFDLDPEIISRVEHIRTLNAVI